MKNSKKITIDLINKTTTMDIDNNMQETKINKNTEGQK